MERRGENGGIIRQPELLSPHVESGSGLGLAGRKTGKTDRRERALHSTQEHDAGRGNFSNGIEAENRKETDERDDCTFNSLSFCSDSGATTSRYCPALFQP